MSSNSTVVTTCFLHAEKFRLFCNLQIFFKIHFFKKLFQESPAKFKEKFKKSSFTIQEKDSRTGHELLLKCSRTAQEHFMNIKLDNF